MAGAPQAPRASHAPLDSRSHSASLSPFLTTRAGNNCATCHHPSRPEKPASALQQACSGCHTKVAAAPMKTKHQAAFHDATAQSGTCISCHKAEKAKAKKAPLNCMDCHKPENK